MGLCANCGHQLGVGRFCTNCGMRVDNAGSLSASAGPSPEGVPPQPRYPLFVDDVVDAEPGAPWPSSEVTLAPTPVEPSPTPPWAPAEGAPSPSGNRPRSGSLPWVVGGVAVLFVAMIGALLLLTGNDDDAARDRPTEETTESTTPQADDPGSPRTKPTEQPPAGVPAADLARYAGVDVPATAPPNQDVSGNQVRYDAENMLDGIAETCWRMPGSGAGEEIVFTFLEPVKLKKVGLINGYAKSSGELDWYEGNRRVLRAEWAFDDGTTVQQDLVSTRDLQQLRIDKVVTTTVTLRLLDVSDPGRGRSARDYTAISDVSLMGKPA